MAVLPVQTSAFSLKKSIKGEAQDNNMANSIGGEQ